MSNESADLVRVLATDGGSRQTLELWKASKDGEKCLDVRRWVVREGEKTPLLGITLNKTEVVSLVGALNECLESGLI